VRQLTFDSNLLNNRGMIGNLDNLNKDGNAANMLTPAELLSSFTSSHADPQRK